MRKIKIAKIDISGGTQSRVAIDESAVADYAEALTDGESLPPVTVFNDGATFWLADGFHRYHAHKKIGALEIEAEVRDGVLMDALLFSYGANKNHGLRRSNSDKRKAVEGMLANFGDWSDNRISKHVGVSQTFVGAVRKPEVAAKQQENRDKSAAKKVEEVKSDLTPAVEVKSDLTPEPEQNAEDFGPSAEELAFLEEQEKADRSAFESVVAIADSDDKLGAALRRISELEEENGRLRAELRVVKEARDGHMEGKNEAIRMVKSLQRKLEKVAA